jgi:RNA polymerase I-specific transcription initiation factor RRN7
VEIYTTVNKLQPLVGSPYSFSVNSKKKFSYSELPEAQIIALVIVSTKLLLPFDDLKRRPTSGHEPSSQVIDWQIWAHAQKKFDDKTSEKGKIGKGNEILINDRDVFNMTGNQLDEYMDWYENGWLDGKGNRLTTVLACTYLDSLILLYSL